MATLLGSEEAGVVSRPVSQLTYSTYSVRLLFAVWIRVLNFRLSHI